MSRLAVWTVALAACGGAWGAGDDGVTPISDMEAMASEYRQFLDAGRTPADIVDWTSAHSPGWERVDPFVVTERKVQAGDRLLFVDRDRTAIYVVVGEEPLATGGARLVCGHIDTPAPRLTATALSSSGGEARLSTYRYGGARSHHWLGIPLGLVGRVAVEGGKEVKVRLGFDDGFSFFGVDQSDRNVIAIAASTSRKKEKPSHTFIRHLYDEYGITADDLASAELYFVPAWPAREVGVDRALIGAHGQDDRLNSYAAWRSLVDVGADKSPPKHTAIAWLVDREEIGSTGPTGARSKFLELTFAWLLRAQGAKADERTLARAFAASGALSSDTPAALNPNFPEPFVERLAPVLGKGPVIFPYIGSGGKQGSHIARAEIIRELIDVFEGAGAPYQAAEFGKVDEGGGGTIAKYLAQRGMDVIDIGIPVVSMHSTLELSSKQDLWSGYLGFKAWLQQ